MAEHSNLNIALGGHSFTGDSSAVVNVDTFYVTALAVLSLRSHYEGSIVLIDCSRSSKEREKAKALATHLGIEYCRHPLMAHGQMLDLIFQMIDSELVFLIDSDAEILSPVPLRLMRECMESDDNAFGAGFVQQESVIGTGFNPYAVYARRMWIPCCVLRTSHVREANRAGVSFQHFKVYNDIPRLPRVSRVLSWRHRVPGLNKLSFRFLDRWRHSYHEVKPSIVYHDTGARVHSWLENRGYRFCALDWAHQKSGIAHHHGVTRRRLNPFDNNSTKPRVAQRQAIERIQQKYPGQLPDELLRH